MSENGTEKLNGRFYTPERLQLFTEQFVKLAESGVFPHRTRIMQEVARLNGWKFGSMQASVYSKVISNLDQYPQEFRQAWEEYAAAHKRQQQKLAESAPQPEPQPEPQQPAIPVAAQAPAVEPELPPVEERDLAQDTRRNLRLFMNAYLKLRQERDGLRAELARAQAEIASQRHQLTRENYELAKTNEAITEKMARMLEIDEAEFNDFVRTLE